MDPSPTTTATFDHRPETPAECRDPQSGETDVWPTIEGYRREEWGQFIYPHVNTEIPCNSMLQNLCPTYKTSGGLAPPPPTMTKTRDNGSSTYCEYLNQLSAVFQNNNKPYTIQFRTKETKGLAFHATGTLCHPDIVAVREYPASASRAYPDHIHWSHLEATGEEDSGKPRKEEEVQPGVFTDYHLQARPDLVSVVGIFVAVSSFKLFLSNACQVYHTPAIKCNNPDARKVLYAWMWRLYNPEIDPSITIDMTTSQRPTFTVTTTDKKTHGSLSVLSAGESLGRRTIVLASCQPNPAPVLPNPSPSIVIKEQYIENGRRFREEAILKKIHEDGRFPGVVRLGHSERVMNDGQPISVEHQTKQKKVTTTVTRSKTRLVLKDKGTRLADVETPREFLKGIYDVLETSRNLYRECKIVHRDFSPENILVVNESTAPTEPLRDGLVDMCFSEYLLDNSAGKDRSNSEDRRRRLTTKVIVIDFDSSEDQDPGNPSLGDPKARTGTPIFMARIVRSNTYPEGFARLPAMPAITPQLLARYRTTLETRLKEFPVGEEEIIEIPPDLTVPRNKFRHLLRHEAESLFWYLLWWCLQTQPANKSPEEGIPHAYWAALTSDPDLRNGAFIRQFPKDGLHSSYAELLPLLNDMRKHLSGDLEFSKHKERNENPEYMHEVFQRLILNFLVVNKNKPFMKLKKSDNPRQVKPSGMNRTRSTQPSKRLLEDPEDNSNRKKPKKN